MPWCHHHPDVQVVTNHLGVATCHKCETARRAAFGLHCQICLAPVNVPGLCAGCARTRGRATTLAWLGQHPVFVLLVIAAAAVLLLWPPLHVFMCESYASANKPDPVHPGDPCIGAAIRGEDTSQLPCTRFVRGCIALIYPKPSPHP